MARIKIDDLSVMQELKTEEQKGTFGGAGPRQDLTKVQADLKNIYQAHGGDANSISVKGIATGQGKMYDQLRTDMAAMYANDGGANSAAGKLDTTQMNHFAQQIGQAGQNG